MTEQVEKGEVVLLDLRTFAKRIGKNLVTVRRWAYRYPNFPKPTAPFSSADGGHLYAEKDLFAWWNWHQSNRGKHGKISGRRVV